MSMSPNDDTTAMSAIADLHDRLCRPPQPLLDRLMQVYGGKPEKVGTLRRAWDMSCKCDLIAEVRADEREKAATRVEARLSPRWPSHVGTEMWFRKEAIAAVRGDS